MVQKKTRKKELNVLLKQKKKREQRDWRLTMKRLKLFQNKVMNPSETRK
ncbi:hypothetical protein ACFFHM_15525 [Halalkalibacter kiskunsagensis]|uniref:Uncharacterized protein n=1 Tax=Halalkalibacter kiskunsagensis TaxID=1548599 RepID=A0ABV6KIN1_9BACI